MSKDITFDWLESKKDLHATKQDTFVKTYEVYRYLTKFIVVLEGEGRARVYLFQMETGKKTWPNQILIGLVHTKKELKEMYKAITFEDLK